MNSEWNKSEPPKDGTPIVAIGKVMFSDEFSSTADPFTAEISFVKPEGGHLGWHFNDGMSVATTLEDQVIIHYWMPLPKYEVPA